MSMFITVIAESKINSMKKINATDELSVWRLKSRVRTVPVLSMKVPSSRRVHMQKPRDSNLFRIASSKGSFSRNMYTTIENV